jgi:hypothetical protein
VCLELLCALTCVAACSGAAKRVLTRGAGGDAAWPRAPTRLSDPGMLGSSDGRPGMAHARPPSHPLPLPPPPPSVARPHLLAHAAAPGCKEIQDMIDARSDLCNGAGAYGAGAAHQALRSIGGSQERKDW